METEKSDSEAGSEALKRIKDQNKGIISGDSPESVFDFKIPLQNLWNMRV